MTNTKTKKDFRKERVKDGKVNIHPGDIFTIEVGTGCISDHVTFTLRNRYSGDEFWPDCVPNRIEGWKMLKSWHEIPNREVQVHNVEEGTTVSFEESACYKYRFG